MIEYFTLLFIVEILVGCSFMCIGMLSCWTDEKMEASNVEPIPFKRAA